jgi:hypothetical protein
MTLQDLVGILKEGGLAAFAGIFLWLYLGERKAHNQTQAERLSDLKVGMDSVHKSVTLLDEARTELHRRGG